jgi:4a-hydroxytetrahydrobiopterin dehydratase
MTATLSDTQISQALRELPGWSLERGKLTRTFTFGSFKEAMSFMVRVGFHAEAAAHHPEIHNVYGTVTLTLCTHDAGNTVTQKDLDLAAEISRFDWTR